MDIRNADTRLLKTRPAAEQPDCELTAPGGFGPFRLLEELGAGGMGRVFRAHDARLDRVVALKVLSARRCASDGVPATRGTRGASRLLREARMAARVTHPSVVAVHEVGEIDGRPYLVQEFIDGTSLRDLLDAHGTLPVAETVAILRGIAEALAAVHAAGVIHRDVKPDNVILGADGRIRLTDFGVAREATDAAAAREAGLYLGTPEYSSPEQCVSEDLDARSDLYSLGVTAFEMLTGLVPHEGDSPVEILSRVATIAPPRLDTLDPDIPAELADLVAQLLKRRRVERYGDAADLMAALERFAEVPRPATATHPKPAPVAAAVERTRPTVRARRRGPARRLRRVGQAIARRGMAAALVAVLAAVAGAVGSAVALFRSSPVSAEEGGSPQAPNAAPRVAANRNGVAIDAAGGSIATSVGRALQRALPDLLAAHRTQVLRGTVVTVREFPESGSLVIEITRDGRLAGKLTYMAHRGIIARAIADVTDWLRAGLAPPDPA